MPSRYSVVLYTLHPHISLPNWRDTEARSVTIQQKLSPFSQIRILVIFYAQLQSQKSILWALPATSPAILRKSPRVKGCLRSSSPARGRDAGYTPATVFKRGITCDMSAQSRSILIMCQACIFFLKASNDKQETKDSERKLGEASIKSWEYEKWALGECLAVNSERSLPTNHPVPWNFIQIRLWDQEGKGMLEWKTGLVAEAEWNLPDTWSFVPYHI